MVLKKLSEAGLHTPPDVMRSFFSQEEQFELVHRYQAERDEEINLLVLHSAEVAVVALGEPGVVTQWVNRSLKGKACVWLSESDELRELVQLDQVIYISNPSKQLVEKAAFLLSKSASQPSSSTAKNMRFDDEDINLHQGCKVVFIFSNLQDIPA
jgi:hypothetical protein